MNRKNNFLFMSNLPIEVFKYNNLDNCHTCYSKVERLKIVIKYYHSTILKNKSFKYKKTLYYLYMIEIYNI